MAEITLRAGYYDRFGGYEAGIKVADIFQECFEPLREGDGSLFSAMAGDVSCEQARIVVKMREDAAEALAAALTKVILAAMKEKDTYNGYPKEEEEENHER